MVISVDLVLKNIGLLATPMGNNPKKGTEQSQIALIENAAVGIEAGHIVYAGPDDGSLSGGNVFDCAGCLVTPGLVDAHTHLVFGGWRHKEMARKLAGESYLDILKSGGGILNTVGKTREASFEELYEKTSALLDESLLFGTTTLEAKSGYGLNLQNEVKCLEVVKKLDEEHPIDLVSTFMGAHAVPNEYKESRDKFVNLICDEMLPVVAEKGLAEFCDVFCETGVFSLDETRTILEKAKSLCMKLKMHAEELSNSGGALLAAELGCISAEHLIKIDNVGINALSKSGVTAVCLPCTSFYINESFAPVREMIDLGVPVALASDFNPGSSPNLNMQLVMNMACYKYKMTPAEILTAVTINAAAAIGKESEIGTLEQGKQADILVWDSSDLDYIFYRYGSNLVKTVVKRGRIVKGG